MKPFLFSGTGAVILVLALLAPAPAPAQNTSFQARDPKGPCFLVVTGEAALAPALENAFAAREGLEILVSSVTEEEPLAGKILSIAREKGDSLAAVIFARFQSGAAADADIAVFHYPFGSLPAERIKSPEYSFKFGSDSALLSLCLFNAWQESDGTKIQIRPMDSTNPYLTRDILRKTVIATFSAEEGGPSPSRAEAVAERIANAAMAFTRDEGFHVMGLLSPAALKHVRPADARIDLTRVEYPGRKDPDKPAVSPQPLTFVFPSGLWISTGLGRTTAYSFTVNDLTRDEKDFHRQADEGSFVSASVGGIVRTVPLRLEDYTPLAFLEDQPAPPPPPAEVLDWVIENVTVFDGTRDAKRFVADVGIAGDRIQSVGDLKSVKRKETIKGDGLFLMPGFIDIHSHADSGILKVASAPSHIRQGITTVLGGNCSFSVLEAGAFFREAEQKGIHVNHALLMGNRPVRQAIMEDRKGQPTYEEMYCQKELMDLAMEEGAFGMSSGLIYKISEEAHTWELAELAKQIKPYGAFYASHIRGETDEVLDAVREAIYIGEIAEVPVQVSHMKVINKRNWGKMGRYLEVIAQARARGLDVTGDQYPWRASGPAGHYALYTLMVREAIKNGNPDVVLLKDMPGRYVKYSGHLLSELLAAEKMTPEQLIEDLDLTADSKIYATYLCLGDEDVVAAMKSDFVMVCTDGGIVSHEDIDAGKTWDEHPRKYRTYPEFFARYVRDRQVCSWELGVYKCTGLPASRLNLDDRGVIRAGAYADLVLLDPVALDPGADYRDQAPPPKGIPWVFLNGRPVEKNGEYVAERAGRVLRFHGHTKP